MRLRSARSLSVLPQSARSCLSEREQSTTIPQSRPATGRSRLPSRLPAQSLSRPSTTPQHGWPAGPSGGCPAVQTLQRSRRASGTALVTHSLARDLLLSKCCGALWELPVEILLCALQVQQQGQQPGAGQKKRSALGDVTNSAVAAAQLPQKVGPAKSLRRLNIH